MATKADRVAKARKQNELKILKQFELRERELNFKRKSYEEQLEKWYREYREHKIQTTMYDDFTSAEKLKIISYRRRQADKELWDKREREKRRAEEAELTRIDQWLKKWEGISAERAKEREEDCWRILRAPEDNREKRLRNKWRKQAKKGTFSVLKRADNADIMIEVSEAHQIAEKELVKAEVEKEKELVHKEMQQAAAEWIANKAREVAARAEKNKRKLKFEQILAATMFQGAWRIYYAQKVLRKKCLKVCSPPM